MPSSSSPSAVRSAIEAGGRAIGQYAYVVQVVIAVGVVLLLLPIFTLVAVQRQTARRWHEGVGAASAGASPSGDPASRFHNVWFQTTTPRAAMRAYRDRQNGDLIVDPVQGHARFEPKGGGPTIALTKIADVRMGGRGSDFVNTWIEVHAMVDAQPKVVFVTDGAWLGWRPLLTRSNLRIVRSLDRLVPAEGM